MSKLKKVIVGAIIGVLILVIAFVGGLLWIKSHSKTASKEKESVKVATTVYKIADAIVSNIKDDRDINIRVSLGLEIKDASKEDKKFVEEISKNDGLATTIIITVLRKKTLAEVSDPQAPIIIGKEIVDELNKAYKTDKFVSVGYKEFIVQ